MGSLYLAVPLATLAVFAMNFIWFGPMKMYTRWISALGVSEEEMKVKHEAIAPSALFGGTLIAILVQVLSIAWLLHRVFDDATIIQAAMLGGVVGFGISAATSLGHRLFAAQGFKVWLYEASIDILGCIVMAIVLAVMV